MDNSKIIKVYIDRYGNEPYTKWLKATADSLTRARIGQRLRRIEQGNLGDSKNVGDSVFELRFNFGPGYRIYYGREKEKLIILLFGGDKNSQKRDILSAKRFWQEYLETENEKT